MNRREALKTAAFSGPAVAALSLAPRGASFAAPTAATALPGRQARGASGGQILESLDGGVSWQCVARLGEQCAVGRVIERDGLFYARIETQGHAFALWSRDARMWRAFDAPASTV